MNTSVDDYYLEELRKTYSYQFHNVSWGLPNGWAPLFGIMCGLIDERLEAAGVRSGRAKVAVFGGWSQVKEKFAGLRAYTHYLRRRGNVDLAEQIYCLIKEAEELSFTVCQVCGSGGTVRTDRAWHQTLCDEHHEEAAKRGETLGWEL